MLYCKFSDSKFTGLNSLEGSVVDDVQHKTYCMYSSCGDKVVMKIMIYYKINLNTLIEHTHIYIQAN